MIDSFAIDNSFLIPLLPLIGAMVAGFLGAKWLKGNSHWPIWIGVGGAAILSTVVFFATIHTEPDKWEGIWAHHNYFTWIEAGDFKVNWGYFFDPLTATMLMVVTGIGLLITIFAAGYMKGEKGYWRFFAYLGLFIFMMTNLVMGENLIMLYLGWEGVGLCSYLLIGYYYDKPAAREAAKKAFLVNRVGDFGFALGIMLTYYAFGTVSYFGDGHHTYSGFLEMATRAPELMTPLQLTAMHWVPFLLMLGAFGKSAQFPLYVWLPDAMEGPTPVSALIHAATMVTAGVYMIARCGVMFLHWSPTGGYTAPLTMITCVGAFTAIFAATIALRQWDLKKVFAYSTVSQLGFMFVGVGVLAPVAGVFHLVTHAFFKALLFLGSGVVMHAMAGELDMRKMSGLKRVLPKTRILMLIGCLALAGFPFFSGFFSKDEIIAAAWKQSVFCGLLLLFTAFVTAYYTFRLYFQVFEGPEVIPPPPADAHDQHSHDTHGAAHDDHAAHGGHDDHAHNHEPALMMVPLYILAIGALVAGFALNHSIGEFLEHSPSIDLTMRKAFGVAANQSNFEVLEKVNLKEPEGADHTFHIVMMTVSGLISMAGIGLAYSLHLRDRARAERLAARVPNFTNAIEHKYWVDEIYQYGVVEPLRALGRAFFAFDSLIVDGLVWIVGFVPQVGGYTLKFTTQRGYLQGYAAAMLFGIAAILILVFVF